MNSSNSYKLIVSKPYLCVATCLSIIIKSSLNKDISQEEIANYFGLYLPVKENVDIKNVHYTSKPFEYGIRVKGNDVNLFFGDYNLPLYEEYKPITYFQDWEFQEEVTREISIGTHLICGYSFGKIFNDQTKIDIGHASILTKIVNRNLCEILDPGPKDPGLKKVDCFALFSAIHHKKDGLWLIRELNK